MTQNNASIVSKNLRIFGQFFRMHFIKMLEYRTNFIIDVFMRFIEFAVFFFMWKSILGQNATIPGWDIKGLLVLYSFQSIFTGVLFSLGYGAFSAWNKITTGELDVLLSRPTIPWVMILGENLSLAFGGLFMGFGGLIIAQLFLGLHVITLFLPLLFLMLALGLGIAILFVYIFSLSAFWLGKSESILNFPGALFEFDSYPQTLFPGAIQTLTSFTFPYLFISTIPALAITESLRAEQIVPYLLIEVGILIVNFYVFQFIWKKGVQRYESYGG